MPAATSAQGTTPAGCPAEPHLLRTAPDHPQLRIGHLAADEAEGRNGVLRAFVGAEPSEEDNGRDRLFLDCWPYCHAGTHPSGTTVTRRRPYSASDSRLDSDTVTTGTCRDARSQAGSSR